MISPKRIIRLTNLTGIRQVPHCIEEYLSRLRLLVPQHRLHAPVDVQAAFPERVRIVQSSRAELTDLLWQWVGFVYKHGQAGTQLLHHLALLTLVAEDGQHLVPLLGAQSADLVPLAARSHRIEIRVHRESREEPAPFSPRSEIHELG